MARSFDGAPFVRFCAIALLVLAAAVPAEAGTVVRNFEGFTDGTILSTQYAGMTFTNAIALNAGTSLNEFEFPPQSGTGVASDNGGPMTINFSPPVLNFSGYFTYRAQVTIQAFDSANNLVGTAVSRFTSNEALSGVPGSSPNEVFQVSSPGGIAKVTITGDPAGASFTLDDATMTVTAPAPNPLSATPATGSGFGAVFQFAFSDLHGWQDLGV